MTAQEGTEAIGAAGFDLEQAPAGPQGSCLRMLPQKLQDVLVRAMLNMRCDRASDIWYEDQTTHTVTVLRGGRQWFLNPTASTIWMRCGERVSTIASELAAQHPSDDSKQIEVYVADFLLEASSWGLLTLADAEEAKHAAKAAPAEKKGS